MSDNNIAEQLWDVYFKKNIQGKVPDLGRVKKIREGFFHGLYCGSDMILKATKLPVYQMEEFIQRFREQIQQGLRSEGQQAMPIRVDIEDRPIILPPGTATN
jgi:hypothetical protein